MIPYGRQDISEADIEAVVAALRSDFLTQGPRVPAFEQALAARCGAAHAVAVSNATAALHITCLALGVGPGDLVWTSPVTFLASANCALYCGAEVDFVDVDPHSWNLCPRRLGERLEQAQRAGRLPKVVIPVHLGGEPCAMDEIHGLARRYGFKVVEDASHAIGGHYRGDPVGSCRRSDAVVFSFHPVKLVTSGEGGAVLVDDAEVARRLRLLRSHGMERDPARLEQPAAGGWAYEQQVLGFNYRLTDLQAALGTSQLERLEAFLHKREALARRYDELLAGLPLRSQRREAHSRSGLHLYIVRLDDTARHASVFEQLRGAGIGVNLHYIPVYLQPYYRRLGFRPGHCPEAERYHASAITLPLYPGLSAADQDHVVRSLAAALK